MLVPSDVGAAGVAEIEERLRLGYSSVFTEIVRYEPTYVFGKGDPESAARARARRCSSGRSVTWDLAIMMATS